MISNYLLISLSKMQLRSGRYILSNTVDTKTSSINTPPPVPIYKPTPSDVVSSYKPASPSEPIVRYIFTLLDKYNNLTKNNDAKHIQLCANIPTNNLKEQYIRNLENIWMIENARIRTEMVSILNENFDVISAVLPPFMLYGIVMDTRYIHDNFNAYKNEFHIITSNYHTQYSVTDVDRIINILLDEIDEFDNKFTQFIVGSYAQSHLYTF